MKYQQKVYAWLYPSGHIQIGDAVPEGAIKLMEGEKENVQAILDGNAETLFDQSGLPFWSLGVPDDALSLPQRYIAAMLWLARIRKSYGALNEPVVFFVNKAANPALRRTAAKAISNKIN